MSVKAARWFTVKVRSSPCPFFEARRCCIPALFSSPASERPSFAARAEISEAARFTVARSAKSASTGMACPPAASISPISASSLARSRATRKTVTSGVARVSAMLRPIPEVGPVTTNALRTEGFFIFCKV